MNQRTHRSKPLAAALACAIVALAATSAFAKDYKVTLSGTEEVPPVTTTATGSGTITVGDDKSISGSVMTKGITGTAAHIHTAAKGQNGPVTIPLTKSGDSTWNVPAGTKLTDDQLKSLQGGNMYVNVHSAAHAGGEIRAQIAP